jgi:ABC-2 type transport system ATP-binding protein
MDGILVEGLVRVFKGGIRAVDGIDLQVAPGEIYGFLGPNGAGKSTTVLVLTTLLPPTEGRATVAGFDVLREGPQVRATIGAALQEAALDQFLTGREHMELQGGLHGLARDERRRRGDELLARVGLSEAADRKVGGYSGGMKRRLDLALALVHRPTILFLDEPTTGLDPQSRLVADGPPEALKGEMGRSTVELVPIDASQRGAFAAVLARFGEPAAAAPKAVAVMLDDPIEGLAEMIRTLDAEGLRVASLEVHQPTLDDVFLQKTGRHLEGASAAGEQEAEPAAVPVR